MPKRGRPNRGVVREGKQVTLDPETMRLVEPVMQRYNCNRVDAVRLLIREGHDALVRTERLQLRKES